MAVARGAERLPDKWDDRQAAGMSEPDLLLYRSNLLGSDLRVTNFGGGNTSAKVRQKDPLTGKDVIILWYFFASELSAKSTGNMLNVDAGSVASFTR